jgi:hypothetical protein
MRKLLFVAVALLCPFLFPLPACGADFKSRPPGVIARVHSLKGLLGDVKHLADLSGQGELFQRFEGLLGGRDGKGMEGIDRGRPFGLYGHLAANGAESTFVALVPVADEKAFLGLLSRLGVKAEKDKGGLYTGTLPDVPFPLSFRFHDDYVYATLGDEAALDRDVLLPPAKVFPAGQVGLVWAALRIDQLSDDFKDLARVQVRRQLAALRDQALLGETRTRRELWKEVVEDAGNLIEAVLRDGRQLEVGFDVDRRSGELTAQVSLDGKPKSKLAATLEELGRSRSLFGGVSAEASALRGLVRLALSGKAGKALAAVIDEATDKGPEKRADKESPPAADFLKALAPSLGSGDVDAVVDLQGPGGEGKPHTLLLGLKLKDGQAAEKAVRDLVKGLPQGDRVQLDADKANGVPIHRVDVRKDLDARAKKAFGDGPAYVAFRADAVMVALGDNALATLKEALAAQPKPGPQASFEVRLARLAPAIALDRGDDRGTVAKAAREAFPSGGRDRLRITLEGGPSLKVRFDMNAAVLKFVGVLEKAEAEGK